MAKLIPYFEHDGKKYEIKRTRFLEMTYAEIKKSNGLNAEQEKNMVDYIKLLKEYQGFMERLEVAEEEFKNDILNEEKEKVYNKLKEITTKQFNEIAKFEIENGKETLKEVDIKSYENGKALLYVALQQKPYELTEQRAKEIWEGFEEQLGMETAKEWIRFMLNELFDEESEEENPFLAQAKARAEQKLNQRNGLAKIRR